MAATSAGDSASSSLRKKLTASRDIPKIPWTAYTNKIANNSGVGWCPNKIFLSQGWELFSDDSERSVSIVKKCYAVSILILTDDKHFELAESSTFASL